MAIHNMTERIMRYNGDADIISVMLGVNEVGYDFNTTAEKYGELIDLITEKQPDASVFIQANLHVSKKRSDKDKVVNNKAIDTLNAKFASFADGEKIFYMDVNAIFDDENGVMNRSILDIDGEILVVSQFTLHASTKKGNRPSYIRAAKPEISIPLYETFCKELSISLGKEVGTGEFGADMKVSLLNDGPVTIIVDSKLKF